MMTFVGCQLHGNESKVKRLSLGEEERINVRGFGAHGGTCPMAIPHPPLSPFSKGEAPMLTAIILVRTHSINGAVMLSEAKHLCFISVRGSLQIDPRFFASLRMTL